jgi:hypothetical protein
MTQDSDNLDQQQVLLFQLEEALPEETVEQDSLSLSWNKIQSLLVWEEEKASGPRIPPADIDPPVIVNDRLNDSLHRPNNKDDYYEFYHLIRNKTQDLWNQTQHKVWTELEPRWIEIQARMEKWNEEESESLWMISTGLLMLFVLLLVTILLWHRTKSRRKPTWFVDTTAPRARADTWKSMTSLLLSPVQRTSTGPNQTLKGPTVSSLHYDAWTPPTPWLEASNYLLPTNTRIQSHVLQIRLELNLTKGLLHNDTKRPTLLSHVRLHVKDARAGVLELRLPQHRTDTSVTMEYTFRSAHEAAQFQNNLLVYQVAGPAILNLYHALQLVHSGSCCHVGKEPLFHDNTGNQEVLLSGVAKDDVRRCLGMLEPIGRALHAFQEDHADEPLDSLAAPYSYKRALMGPVDFFALFCHDDATRPQDHSSPQRFQSLLQLRRLVADASRYVQAYVQARCVIPWSPRRRLAFDDSADNIQHDATAKNEYYEPSVSHDVTCQVHSVSHFNKPGHCQPSAYQAYNLVACHVIRLDDDENSRLRPDQDPLEALPSLQRILRQHPDLDFFGSAFFPEGYPIALVKLFVRSLPKGVDPSFDTVMERFRNGNSDLRNSKLQVFFQLGPGKSLSPLVWAAIKAVSVLLSFSRNGEAQVPVESSGVERTHFPGMKLSNYLQLRHFGGSLQNNASMPNNYVAFTALMDSSKMTNILFRVLYKRLEEEALPACVVDFTFVLEGQDKEELPERALGSIRMVHYNLMDCAVPMEQHEEQEFVDEPIQSTRSRRSRHHNPLSPVGNWGFFSKNEKDTATVDSPRVMPCEEEDDPFRDGVDSLIDILSGISVPIRRGNLEGFEPDLATPITEEQGELSLPPHLKRQDVVNLEILEKLTRHDLRRYYLACDCDLKAAAVRVVESAAWRGIRFPIDTTRCRVELQTGMFFQQGEDFWGNPVFYFRNMCAGPWRNDPDAVIDAVLHRLETGLAKLSRSKPNVKITLVVLLGKPHFATKKKRKKKQKKDDESATRTTLTGETGMDEDDATVFSSDGDDTWNPYKMGVNPRLQPGEGYHEHNNPSLLKRLLDIVMLHYPERLNKALFVPGTKRGYGYWGTAVGTQIGIRNCIDSPRTRTKCFILHRIGELKDFIPPSQIITIAGGEALLNPEVFECDS